MQKEFAANARDVVSQDPSVIGLAVGGSWLSNEIDEYSDLDLILVTKQKVSSSPQEMIAYAQRLGNFLNGFTGEHVGEPRVLICLYDDPLLHVDIKFLTLDEFHQRVENPHLLLDREGQLQQILDSTQAHFPLPDYQWIEDRFWTWVHYALLKIGRGEYTEAFDFFGYLRMVVFGPLLHLKNKLLPRGVRKVETLLAPQDFQQIKSTIPTYARTSLLESLQNGVELYRDLRKALYPTDIVVRTNTETQVMKYFEKIAQM
ncbi:MAG TPA: hypothetical protein DCS93_19530 [Microscillaceae bacterium]|nr:hypothetical protein [Microscillaceae bacterium]